MQNSTNDLRDKHGCFVYKLIESCAVRDCPNVSDEYRSEDTHNFRKGDLVSVDLIAPSRSVNSPNGPFLRLADKNGWLFERKHTELIMEKIPVEVGFWTFYIGNYPRGIVLMHHPNDDKKGRVKPVVNFYPMQKIYCDRKVTSDAGVNFYRVQGIDGWVFETRGENTMLIPEKLVRTGLFAYQNIWEENLIIRNKANISDEYKTDRSVKSGDIVAVDLVLNSSQYDPGNGPFLRLTDGAGWLFVSKFSKQMMEVLPIISGTWKLQVVHSDGIAARIHPSDNQKNECLTFYHNNEECICDKMIASPSNVNFYRVKGTIAWVCDKRDGRQVMKELSHEGSSCSHSPWTPDFVRGMAIAVGGIEEVSINERSHIISFRDNDDVGFNIYYTQRTIAIVMCQPEQDQTQIIKRNCSDAELNEALRNPHHHKEGLGNGFKKIDSEVDEEAELRLTLHECDKKMQLLLGRKAAILKSIDEPLKKRVAYAKIMDSRRNEYVKETRAKEKKNGTRMKKGGAFSCLDLKLLQQINTSFSEDSAETYRVESIGSEEATVMTSWYLCGAG